MLARERDHKTLKTKKAPLREGPKSNSKDLGTNKVLYVDGISMATIGPLPVHSQETWARVSVEEDRLILNSILNNNVCRHPPGYEMMVTNTEIFCDFLLYFISTQWYDTTDMELSLNPLKAECLLKAYLKEKTP